MLTRLHVVDARCLVVAWLCRASRRHPHLSILHEEIELLLAVADVVLVEAVVEVVASILRTDVVWRKGLRVLRERARLRAFIRLRILQDLLLLAVRVTGL